MPDQLERLRAALATDVPAGGTPKAAAKPTAKIDDGHTCDAGHFDRTICPEPCGSMHFYCSGCGARQDVCTHDVTVVPGQDLEIPTAEAVAEALTQYETGGVCHYGQTCGLCDCGRAEQTPERQQEWDEHQLDRARAVLALIPPQRCAPRPSIRKGSIMNGELPELHDPNWITGRSLDQKLADWESLAKRGQVYNGNQAVLDLIGDIRSARRPVHDPQRR